MAYVEASVRRRQLVAAARSVMAREGVAGTSLRAVAAESGVPLGTLQYVFPARDLLLRAVMEDVVGEVAGLLEASVDVEHGLAHAIRQGLTTFWSELVAGQAGLQVMQYELLNHALREPGQVDVARWQYERYTSVIAAWCQQAADAAGESCAVPFDRLARVMLAAVDGLIVQYVCDADDDRAWADLDAVIEMVLALARIEPAAGTSAG